MILHATMTQAEKDLKEYKHQLAKRWVEYSHDVMEELERAVETERNT